MTNNEEELSTNIKVGGQELKVLRQYKYLGLIISEEGSGREIISSAAQRMAAAIKLKTILKDKNICHKSKISVLISESLIALKYMQLLGLKLKEIIHSITKKYLLQQRIK